MALENVEIKKFQMLFFLDLLEVYSCDNSLLKEAPKRQCKHISLGILIPFIFYASSSSQIEGLKINKKTHSAR